MLSRVAESIYWMARYVERAENLARFVDVKLNFVLDQPPGLSAQWDALVSVTGDNEYFQKKYGEATAESVVQFMAFDRDYPSSIINCVGAARENARSVSETISSEMWEQLNEFHHWLVRSAASTIAMDAPYEFFRQVKQHAHLFHGITDATLSRGLGWNFFHLGRMLERADKVSRIVDVKYFTLLPGLGGVSSSLDDLQWSSILRSVSALEMYRKSHQSVNARSAVDFLVLNREFPRAIHCCVMEADKSLHAVGRTPVGAYSNQAERTLGQLRAELAYADVEAIFAGGLHEYIDRIQVNLNSVGQAIHERFFAFATGPESNTAEPSAAESNAAESNAAESAAAGSTTSSQLQ